MLMEPSKDAENVSWKGGKLFFNRFCIDEDAACELSGVYYLKESSTKLAMFSKHANRSEQLQAETESKGESYLLLELGYSQLVFF